MHRALRTVPTVLSCCRLLRGALWSGRPTGLCPANPGCGAWGSRRRLQGGAAHLRAFSFAQQLLVVAQDSALGDLDVTLGRQWARCGAGNAPGCFAMCATGSEMPARAQHARMPVVAHPRSNVDQTSPTKLHPTPHPLHVQVVVAHNGPAGLGARRHSICGVDWMEPEADFGDPDLQAGWGLEGRVALGVACGHVLESCG